MLLRTKSGRKVRVPTAAEERAINAGIARDPDTYVLGEEEFKQLRPALRGRPKSAVHKIAVKVRLDPHIVAHFRAAGRGWQTRLNAALAAHVKREERRPGHRS
jgi:uncharacterized protein (DUF4415 family)